MVSTLPFIKPFEIRNVESLSYQALGACFELYKTLSNLKTKSGYVGSTYQEACSTFTSSSIKPFKNALLIFI